MALFKTLRSQMPAKKPKVQNSQIQSTIQNSQMPTKQETSNQSVTSIPSQQIHPELQERPLFVPRPFPSEKELAFWYSGLIQSEKEEFQKSATDQEMQMLLHYTFEYLLRTRSYRQFGATISHTDIQYFTDKHGRFPYRDVLESYSPTSRIKPILKSIYETDFYPAYLKDIVGYEAYENTLRRAVDYINVIKNIPEELLSKYWGVCDNSSTSIDQKTIVFTMVGQFIDDYYMFAPHSRIPTLFKGPNTHLTKVDTKFGNYKDKSKKVMYERASYHHPSVRLSESMQFLFYEPLMIIYNDPQNKDLIDLLAKYFIPEIFEYLKKHDQILAKELQDRTFPTIGFPFKEEPTGEHYLSSDTEASLHYFTFLYDPRVEEFFKNYVKENHIEQVRLQTKEEFMAEFEGQGTDYTCERDV